ncbi:DUF1127 domain-containing protein [Paracoccus cavernae]|uniref:DUF1127 domain-containing protein n=1 Tax=Paracoccus cavernae TaxID=1571207 RepID=A0ABT8D216_9RHOB|nr:DUF1127 domain-containing protein [Paracoccus cavernae]
MTALHAEKTATASHGLFARLGAMLSATVSAISEARLNMAQYHALNRMSDRELETIGLRRGDLIAHVFSDKA